MSIRTLIRSVVPIAISSISAFAGTYGPQNFESYAVGTFSLNAADGTLVSSTGSTTVTAIQTPVGGATPRAVRLTAAGTGSYYGAWKLPVLDAVGTVTAFDATFKCQVYNTGDMADGFTFNFGAIPGGNDPGANEDTDKNVSLLGMPADADWVLQTIYNDKTGMRNMLPQTLMQEVNGIGSGVRAKFVEVFFNQDGGPISYADYRGVYVLMERIERGTDRVDISKLSPLATDPAVISGGYIFKKDKLPQAPMYSTTSTGTWGSQTH